MEVVINTCVGEYGVSAAAVKRLKELGSDEDFSYYEKYPEDNHYVVYDDCRHHPLLLQVIKEMGVMAAGEFARLKVIDIPDGVQYHIMDCGGVEWVVENFREWR